MNYDVLIVGGGVIGLSLARELHGRRQRRIAVVDKGRVGREASFAAGGMLAASAENEVIDDFYRLCDESRRMFPRFAEELLDETGIDIELDTAGTLYTAFTEADSEHLAVRHARQTEAGIPAEKLSAAEARAAEPHLSPTIRESLYFPNDWQVENRKLLAALIRYAELADGIDLLESTAVDSVVVERDSALGIAGGGRRISAGTVVLATGAWTSLIKIGDVPVPLSVRPIRGQMISFAPAERLFGRVVYSPRGYIIPRADGRILAGATVEDVGFDTGLTPEAEEMLTRTAMEISPALGRTPIAEAWAGLRPLSDDALPILGAVPGLANLQVAAGHYRNGILLAPITARLLADSLSGERPVFLDIFGPERGPNRKLNANA